MNRLIRDVAVFIILAPFVVAVIYVWVWLMFKVALAFVE